MIFGIVLKNKIRKNANKKYLICINPTLLFVKIIYFFIIRKHMDSEIVKVSDARVQSLGLKFTFSTEGDKLIIEASCSKDNQKYVGEIIANPYVDL